MVGVSSALQYIVFKFLQEEKAFLPMVVTPSGIVMEVRRLQPRKAELPMLVTPSGIVMEVRLLQREYL